MIFILPLLSPREDLKQFVREAVALSVWKVEKTRSIQLFLRLPVADVGDLSLNFASQPCLVTANQTYEQEVLKCLNLFAVCIQANGYEVSREVIANLKRAGLTPQSGLNKPMSQLGEKNWSSQRNMRQLSEIFAFVIPQTSRLSSIG